METHAAALARLATPPLTVLEVEALRRDCPAIGAALDAYEQQLRDLSDKVVELEDDYRRSDERCDDLVDQVVELQEEVHVLKRDLEHERNRQAAIAGVNLVMDARRRH